MPPVYLRTQQLSWLEITPVVSDRSCHAQLKSARVELPGATRFERFLAAARNPHSSAPMSVASWPEGPDWPVESRHLKHRHLKRAKKAVSRAANCQRQ
jgi:hypothetical protein